MEGSRKATIPRMTNHMMHAPLARDDIGRIVAAIIDDQNFDCLDTFNPFRQSSQCRRQAVRFVEARDLDNQFSHASP